MLYQDLFQVSTILQNPLDKGLDIGRARPDLGLLLGHATKLALQDLNRFDDPVDEDSRPVVLDVFA
ncbi:MAG: hypothetical protein OXG18_05860 [Gemmatimonadetes bacterium]|nr:hypothetical protein [Gemmatimonadota bacterium]